MDKTKTALHPDLIKAYEATAFEVHTSTPFVLRIGEFSEDLRLLFSKESVDCGCFITAYNPFSEPRTAEKNMSAQRDLKKQLVGLGNSFLDGLGADPSGEWEGEPSFFVLGLSIEKSRIIGQEYNQNAVVWCGKACIPDLVLLR